MVKVAKVVAVAILTVLFGAFAVWAQHDANCVDCHSLHYSKTTKMLMANESDLSTNFHTNKPLEGIDSMCMGCHKGEKGTEISIMKTHPVGMVPVKVQVPENLLRDGKISCMGCHEPHPSNTNYKYLIKDTEKGAKMYEFCGLCHGNKLAPVHASNDTTAKEEAAE